MTAALSNAGPAASAAAPAVPAGTRVYAVGDIHGRADLVERLHLRMRLDAADAPETRCIVVYLGDYIDRGLDSRGVLDAVAGGPGPEFDAIHLKGNHEDFLLRFLDNPSGAHVWLANGGVSTIRSYGVRPELSASASDLRDRFAGALPDRHRRFLSSLRLSATVGDYFFVHAGVRPGVALDAQDPDDMLWIRDEFLSAAGDFGKVVVHGHTPTSEPAFEGTRIGIDTMAWASGRLTCLVLHGTAQGVLQT